MIQKETNLVVADNSGARKVRAFTLYGGSKRKTSYIGDIIQCSVKEAIPNGKVKKGDIVRCVIVRCKKPTLDVRNQLKDQMVAQSPLMTTLLLSLTMIMRQLEHVSSDLLLVS